MDSYTRSRFTVQPAGASPSSNMDSDPAEAAATAQDLDIKREASYGTDGDTNMADIPPSADAAAALAPAPPAALSEPRSSQPPSSAISQTDGPADTEGAGRSGPSAARAAKKKGTATLVKKTTSRKTGGARGGRGGRGRRRVARSVSSSRGYKAAAAASDDDEELGSQEDEESDHGPYCLCRGPDDHRWMIGCDVCEDWFHGECVSIDKAIGEALIQRYVCPRCTDDKGINVTRYKKTCSLEGCFAPARIYDGNGGGMNGSAAVEGGRNYSVFCSDRHAEDWWEQLVRSLPENRKLKAKEADLTREKFMGLLNVSTVYKPEAGEEPWRVGKKPFAIPSEFWSTVDQSLVLTPEEQTFLRTSAADRYALAEEIVLNKKMQQLLDLANERRKAAISAGLCDKDTCGYDFRLDMVGCPVEFGHFVKSPQGEAIYRGNSLAADGSWTEEQVQAATADGREWNPATAAMCDRRRCKPHASWYNTFTKSTRHVIKELARQAKEKLDAETRMREAAATRHYRRRHERTSVVRLDDTMVMT